MHFRSVSDITCPGDIGKGRVVALRSQPTLRSLDIILQARAVSAEFSSCNRYRSLWLSLLTCGCNTHPEIRILGAYIYGTWGRETPHLAFSESLD